MFWLMKTLPTCEEMSRQSRYSGVGNLVNLVVNFEDELMFFFIDSQNLSLDFFVIVHVIVVLKDCWRKGNDLFWDKCNVFLFFAKFSTTFVGLGLKMGVS